MAPVPRASKIGDSSLGNWCVRPGGGCCKREGLLKTERVELARLRHKGDPVAMERDLLNQTD